MPQFSIIMPLYNKAPYVERSIMSVLQQSFRDWELIIVDDGSTDGGDEIVSSLFKDGRITFIKQANSGVSTARNNGVAHSIAPMICFLDADDWWEPSFLEELNGIIGRYPQAGIYGTSYWIVKNGKKHLAPIGLEEGFIEGEINYCQVYAKTLCMPLWTGAVCMPRAIFDKMQGFNPNLKLGEDFDLWIRIVLKYPVVFMNKPLSNYNQDVNSSFRGIGRLHTPQSHMLWNLGYLEHEEIANADYKKLIDRLRVYCLKPYFLSPKYHDITLDELSKIDWSNQQLRDRHYYCSPIWLLRIHNKMIRIALTIRNKMRKAV